MKMRKITIIILAMLFLGFLIVIFTIVIGFDEDPGREPPNGDRDDREYYDDAESTPRIQASTVQILKDYSNGTQQEPVSVSQRYCHVIGSTG
jgi:hypothetical protein